MTAPTPPGVANPEATGITAEALRLVGSVTRHFQALLALAELEGREALSLYLRLAIVLGAALFFAAFGYIFVVLFIAFAIADLAHVDWLWISLGFAVLHLLLALIGGLYIKQHFRTPIFRGMAEEIRKDAEALRTGAHPLI